MNPKRRVLGIFMVLFLLIILVLSGNGPCGDWDNKVGVAIDNAVGNASTSQPEWVGISWNAITGEWFCPAGYKKAEFGGNGTMLCRLVH